MLALASRAAKDHGMASGMASWRRYARVDPVENRSISGSRRGRLSMARFDFIRTPLAGLISVQRKVIEDQRGFLSRFYCADEFREIGLGKPIAQINHTLTRSKGAGRGLHFQYPPL